MNWIRLKSPPIACGERLDRHRLGEARHALDEEVAAGEEGDGHPLEEVVLADDDLLHLVQQALHRAPAAGRAVWAGSTASPPAGLRQYGGQAGGAAGDVDRHDEADPDEDVLVGRVDEGGHDPDDAAVAVEERAAGVARD